MKDEKKKQWIAIAEQVAHEEDPVKFDQLATELIRLLREQSELLHPTQNPQLPGSMEYLKLTSREQEVLHQLVQGKSNREIGATLGLSEGTVKVYVSHLLAKLRVRNRLQVMAVATMGGLIFQPVSDDHKPEAA